MAVKNEQSAPKKPKLVETSAPVAAKSAPAKKEAPKKPTAASAAAGPSAADFAKKAQKDLDARTLFVKNLPEDVTDAEIRELTTGKITEIRLKTAKLAQKQDLKKNKTSSFQFAHIEFADVATTEKNYAAMQKKSIRDKEIIVDYVGEKSVYAKKEEKKKKAPKEKMVDSKRLHVSGYVKSDTTHAELKKFFPGCIEFTMPIKKHAKKQMGFAIVGFTTETEAQRAHEANNGREFKESKLKVNYAFVKKEEVAAAKKKKLKSGKNKFDKTAVKEVKESKFAKIEFGDADATEKEKKTDSSKKQKDVKKEVAAVPPVKTAKKHVHKTTSEKKALKRKATAAEGDAE